MEDVKIVELYLQRDESAIAATAEKYGAQLRSIAMRLTDDPHIAEECENDTYLKAWNAIPPHVPKTYFPAFLIRLVRNTALDRCRENNRLKRGSDLLALSDEMLQCIAGSQSPENEVDHQLLADAINSFLRKQTPLRRGLFIRRYWHMDSIAAIAAHYRISESKTKVTLHRIRNELKSYLEKEGYFL